MKLGTSLAAAALVAGLASLFSAVAPAHAQTRSEAEIREQYLAERAVCLARYTGEEQKNCLREAGAAAQAARQGNLGHDEEEERYRQNALARCTPLPPDQREACRMRIEGAGTVRGSVEGGGLYRELRTIEPAPQATTAPVLSPAPTTTVVPPTTTVPPVVAPAAPPVAAPAPTTPPAVAPAPATPAAPAAGTPGGPTFTPVQPVVPGRAVAAPTPAPTAPAAAAPVGTTGAMPGGTADAGSPPAPASLQISPPATPVLQVPVAPAAGAVQPSAPEPLLVAPGNAPPESAR